MPMRQNWKQVRMLTVLWLVLVLANWPAVGQEALWTTARAKMLTDSGYSMEYHYSGDEGLYKFTYIVQGDGDKIFTEVLDGSERGAGSKILYDPAADKDNVLMKTHMMTLRRSLEAKDINDSSLYQPLFRQLVGKIGDQAPREYLQVAGGNTVIVFGSKTGLEQRLEVDSDGDPVALRTLEKSHEIESMKFIDLKWGMETIPWD